MPRITKGDLMLAGWHSIYYGRGGERWAHPEVFGTQPFREAAKLQKKFMFGDIPATSVSQ